MPLQYDKIYSVVCSRPVINNGGTLALFIDVVPGQVYTVIKNVGNTGGLELLQCSSGASLASGGSQLYTTPNFISGSTLTAAFLAAVSGTGYPLAANEVLTFTGPVRCYLAAPSASCQVAIIKGVGAGI